MKKRLLFIFILGTSGLLSNTEMGCSISGLLKVEKSTLLEDIKDINCTKDINTSANIDKIAISKKLKSIKVLHESEEIIIDRKALKGAGTCPPFCIEPMNIDAVVTVGELEVLSFIDKLKEKKARLLIDVRKNSLYSKGTIPGAINLPSMMLEDKSKYQVEVLKLLGAKLVKKSKWSFKEAQVLLIFGSSTINNDASTVVKKLLKLGYPSSKLLYYRAGMRSWKASGLTVY